MVFKQDRGGCTVEDFCNHIHRNLLKDVKYVLVWGTSARHYPQHCGLAHNLHDEDVVQIVKKKVWFLHLHQLPDPTARSFWFIQAPKKC